MSDLDDGELIAEQFTSVEENYAHRMFNPKLMALRTQLPFIPIMPFPNESLAYLLLAGVAQDINLPSGTKAVMFSGNGEYYVTRKGRAQIPTAVHEDGSGAIMNPEFFLWHVEEISQFSAVSVSDVRLSVHCFTQL